MLNLNVRFAYGDGISALMLIDVKCVGWATSPNMLALACGAGRQAALS
jgi:hypothetical protein